MLEYRCCFSTLRVDIKWILFLSNATYWKFESFHRKIDRNEYFFLHFCSFFSLLHYYYISSKEYCTRRWHFITSKVRISLINHRWIFIFIYHFRLNGNFTRIIPIIIQLWFFFPVNILHKNYTRTITKDFLFLSLHSAIYSSWLGKGDIENRGSNFLPGIRRP